MPKHNKLVKLPLEGKALIITDLHGNIIDYRRYEKLWNTLNLDVDHVIITGDFIHPVDQGVDGSIEILNSLKYYHDNYQNFHVLLGNHEWVQLISQPIYKLGTDQTLDFQQKVKKTYPENWGEKIIEYHNFFENLPLAVKTSNGAFISHAGPSRHIKNINDIININTDYFNPIFEDMLWRYYSDFTDNDIISFLERIDCNVHIVGHTPVNGFKIIANKMIVISSINSKRRRGSRSSITRQNSYNQCKKAYVMLDLESRITDAKDLINMIKCY